MPELPEVQTTVNGLNTKLRGLKISDVWTSYNSSFHAGKGNIKNPDYFKKFKKEVVGTKILRAERVGKNILIHLKTSRRGSGQATILTHMKMTGHFLYGKYVQKNNSWEPEEKIGPLRDPFNRHVRLVFSLSNGKHLAFSDTRKFGKVFIFDTDEKNNIEDLKALGPDPLSKSFTYEIFKERLLKKPHWKIKQTLMDQTIIAGIGNIYSDEILWIAGVHPLSVVEKIPEEKMKVIFKATKPLLLKGIDFGGDSMSDYRNIHGLPGNFQNKHQAYRRTGKLCSKKDGGTIQKIKAAGRSAHFCLKHQQIYL